MYFCTSILTKLWQNTILCWLGQLAYLPWNTFKWLVFPNLLTVSVHDEGYSKNETCTLRYKCIHVWVYTVTERSCTCMCVSVHSYRKVMYLCVRVIDFVSFYDFDIWFSNIPTVWYFCFYPWYIFWGGNYTLYKNTGFWLVNSRDIILQIQALHCEFAECLLHVDVFAWDLTFFHGICKIVFTVFTLHRDACNKICKTLSVVRFMLHHSVELNKYIMLGPENDKQKVLFI